MSRVRAPLDPPNSQLVAEFLFSCSVSDIIFVMQARNRWISRLFTERIHVSWLIASFCFGVIVGVSLAYSIRLSQTAEILFLVIAMVLLVLVFLSRLRVMIFFVLISGALFGIWRGNLVQSDLDSYKTWVGKSVVIIGSVESDPDFVSSSEVRLRLNKINIISSAEHDQLSAQSIDDIKNYFTDLPGRIWASSFTHLTDIKRGDKVEIAGKMKAGFGSFSASIGYGSIKNVERAPNSDPLGDMRDAFGAKLRAVIDEPEASLGMGILAGQKTALPADLSAAFIIASLSHIVVASGYNLTILIRFARRIFAKISRFAGLVFGAGLMLLFVGVTGLSPSMERASLVAGLSLIAWYYGRKFHPMVLLLFVASITIIFDPTQLWGDAGWYLSFLSFAGVIVLAPLIRDYFWGDKTSSEASNEEEKTENLEKRKRSFRQKVIAIGASIRQVFIETLSAQIMAMPIIVLFMGQFAPYGLIANLLVLPILPLTMLLTFMAGMASAALPIGVAEVVAEPANWLLSYIVKVANWVSDLPGASQNFSISPMICGAFFLILIGVVLYLKHRTKHNFYADNVVE